MVNLIGHPNSGSPLPTTTQTVKTDSWKSTATKVAKITLLVLGALALGSLAVGLFLGATLASKGVFPIALATLAATAPTWIKTSLLIGASVFFSVLVKWVNTDSKESPKTSRSDCAIKRDMINDLLRIYSDSAKTQLIIKETHYYVSEGDDTETANRLFDQLQAQLSVLVDPKDVWEIIDQLHQGGMAPLVTYSIESCETLEKKVINGDHYITKLVIDTNKDIHIEKTLIQEIEENAELRQNKGYIYKNCTSYTLATYSDTSPSQFLCLSSKWSLKNKAPSIHKKLLSKEEADEIRKADLALILGRTDQDPHLE